MRLQVVAALVAMSLTSLSCSRGDKAERDPDEDSEAQPRPKRSSRSSSKRLVFDEAPTTTAPARLTFEPAPTQPTVVLPARYNFFLEAVHRIGPQIKSLEAAPRIKQVSVRPERVDVELIAGDLIRSIDLKGDAVLDRGTKKDLIIKTAAELSERAFTTDDVDWAKIPSLVNDAASRVTDGEGVDFVSIKRPLPFSKDVQIRVFIQPRAFVDYTARGAFISASQ